jgi:hypothetical protein
MKTNFSNWLRQLRTIVRQNNDRRLRRCRTRPLCPIAAEVQQLESRQLLTVTFHGGAVLPSVEAQGVYLGSDWQNNASLRTQAGQLDQFVSTIVRSPYMDALSSAGYGVGRGTSSGGIIVTAGINKSVYLTDSVIQSDLQSLVAHNQVQAPDANRLYIVYVEPGVAIRTSDGGTSISSFLGYHSTFVGRTASGQATNIRYAVMPYPGSPNPTAGSSNFSSNFAQLTAVTSHELSEAVTDPDAFTRQSGGRYIGGWWDDAYLQSRQPPEIGDITINYRTTFDGYTVQEMSDRNDRPIDPNNFGGGGTTNLQPPVLSAYASSPTTATLTWNAVSGVQGYRVYYRNGNQAVLLETLSASTTSAQIGMAPGTTSSFLVEAFNGSQVADSAWVSVTTPVAQGVTAPQVSVSAISQTSVSISWNYQSAAQGYRIYWWNGSQAVLLGSVVGTTTRVQVNGLRAGSVNYFLVEVYSSSQVADSQWVSVVTPFARVSGAKTGAEPGPMDNSRAIPTLQLLQLSVDGFDSEAFAGGAHSGDGMRNPRHPR